MRHRNKIKKLGRTKSHREATLRNIARAIFENHQIKTTLAKAKAARSYVERLITYGKEDTVAARRLAFKRLQSHQLVKKLFDEIAPTFADRSGGYTRVIKLGRRQGDGAEIAVLQLVGFEPLVLEEKKPKKAKKKAAPAKKEVEKKAEVSEETARPAEAPAEAEAAPEEKPAKKKAAKKAAPAKKTEKAEAAPAEKKEEKAEKPAKKKETKAAAEKKTRAKAESKPEEKSGETEKPADTEEEKPKE